jgi:hypothetical protein
MPTLCRLNTGLNPASSRKGLQTRSPAHRRDRRLNPASSRKGLQTCAPSVRRAPCLNPASSRKGLQTRLSRSLQTLRLNPASSRKGLQTPTTPTTRAVVSIRRHPGRVCRLGGAGLPGLRGGVSIRRHPGRVCRPSRWRCSRWRSLNPASSRKGLQTCARANTSILRSQSGVIPEGSADVELWELAQERVSIRRHPGRVCRRPCRRWLSTKVSIRRHPGRVCRLTLCNPLSGCMNWGGFPPFSCRSGVFSFKAPVSGPERVPKVLGGLQIGGLPTLKS